MKSSFLSVFIDGFSGLIEEQVVLSQYFPLIFRFILDIFVSFSVLFHGNSAFFMDFRGYEKYESYCPRVVIVNYAIFKRFSIAF